MLCRECGRTVGRLAIASDLVSLEGNGWGAEGQLKKVGNLPEALHCAMTFIVASDGSCKLVASKPT